MVWKSSYLLVYNIVQFSLWTITGVQLILSARTTAHYSGMYEAAAPFAMTSQLLAWAEVFHAMIGIGGTVTTSFVQCVGRFVVLAFVVDTVGNIQDHVVTILLLGSWILGDLVRYAFYIATIVGFVPQALLWMRYSFFLILYPLGMSAEWLIYYLTISYIDTQRVYSISLPNKFNFAFDFGVWNRIVLVMYMFFGPFMFSHMLRQRRKKLGPETR